MLDRTLTWSHNVSQEGRWDRGLRSGARKRQVQNSVFAELILRASARAMHSSAVLIASCRRTRNCLGALWLHPTWACLRRRTRLREGSGAARVLLKSSARLKCGRLVSSPTLFVVALTCTLLKAEREAARALKQQDRAEKAVQAERDKAWQQANKLRKDKAETMTELRVEFEYPLTTPSGPIPRTYELIKQSIEEDGAEVTVVPESEVSRRRNRSLAMATDEALYTSLQALSVVRIIRKSRATLDTIRRTFVPLLDGQVTLEDEKTVFVFVAHHHLLEMAEKKALMKTLRSFRVCMGYETHQIVLLTYGLDNFFRLQEQAANREYTQQIRNQVGQGAGAAAAPSRQKSKHAQPITITREQLDSELIRLRIAERVYLSKLEKEHDLVPWFVSMVRDVAIRPYK